MNYINHIDQSACSIEQIRRIYAEATINEDRNVAESLKMVFVINPELTMEDVEAGIPWLLKSQHALNATIEHALFGHPRAISADELSERYPTLCERISQIDSLYERLSSFVMGHDAVRDLPCMFGPKFSTGGERYELLEALGIGSQGTVYRALDRMYGDELVAVKIFRHPGTRIDEAIAMMVAKHPSVANIIDHGSVNGVGYAVYELIEGERFESWLELRAAMGWKTKARMIMQLGEAIATAHANGVIHRDIKPSNVIIAEGLYPILTDFGIAIQLEDALSASWPAGSAQFAAPEQFHGRTMPASDVYGLAGLLYWMMSGHAPNSDDPERARHNLKMKHRVNTDQLRCPRRLRRVLDRALDPDPYARTSSVHGLISELRCVLNHTLIPIHERGRLLRGGLAVRRNPGKIAAGLLALVVLGGAYKSQSGSLNDRIEQMGVQITDANTLLDEREAKIDRLVTIQEHVQAQMKISLAYMNSIEQRQLVMPGVEPLESLRVNMYLQQHFDRVDWAEQQSTPQERYQMVMDAITALPDDTRPEDLAVAHEAAARIAYLIDRTGLLAEQIANWGAAASYWGEVLPADSPIIQRINHRRIQAASSASFIE